MLGKITLANEIITLVMYFIMAITLFWSLQIIIADELAPVNLQIIFLLYFVGVLVIRFFVRDNFLIYIGCHLLLFLTLFAVPYSGLVIFEYIVFLVSLLTRSIAYWQGMSYRYNADVPALSFIIMFVLYIYAFATGHILMTNYLFVTGSIYLILYLIRLYLKGLYNLSHGKVVHKMLPLEQLVKSNSAIVGMVILAAGIAVILANIINMDNLLYTIGDAIVAVVRFVVRAIVALLNWMVSRFDARSGDASAGLLESMQESLREEGIVAKIIDLVISLGTVAFFIIFMWWTVRGLYRYIVYFLKNNILPTDHVEKLTSKNNTMRLFMESIKKNRINEPESHIRRQYKKEIKRMRDRIMLTDSMTTGEIEAQMSDEEAETMRPLKCSYERERYFDEEE